MKLDTSSSQRPSQDSQVAMKESIDESFERLRVLVPATGDVTNSNRQKLDSLKEVVGNLRSLRQNLQQVHGVHLREIPDMEDLDERSSERPR